MPKPDVPDAPRNPVAEPGRSLRSNVAFAVAGMGFYGLCQLLVPMLLAKFTTSAILGNYFFALAISTPIVLLFALELRAVFVSDVRNEFSFGAFKRLRAWTLSLAAICLLGVLAGCAAAGWSGGLLLQMGGVFAGKLLWSYAELGWGVFNRRERLDLTAGATMLRGATLLVPYALMLPLAWVLGGENAPSDETMAWWAGACTVMTAAGWVLLQRVYDARWISYRNDLRYGCEAGQVRRLAARSAPMGFVSMAVNLNDSFPRIVLHQVGSAVQLGYFGAIATLAPVGQLIVVQAVNAAANRIAIAYREDTRRFFRIVGKLLGLAAGVGVAMLAMTLLVGGPLLTWLFKPEYAEHAPEFRLLMGAQVLALVTAVLGLTATQMGLFWPQVPAQVATLGATLAAALMLIPADPVRGAALTAVVRAAVQFLAYLACVTWGLSKNHSGSSRPPRSDDAPPATIEVGSL